MNKKYKLKWKAKRKENNMSNGKQETIAYIIKEARNEDEDKKE